MLPERATPETRLRIGSARWYEGSFAQVHARTRAIPILLCSVTRSESDMKQAIEYGAAGFMPKPLSREMLKRILEKTLGG